MKFKHLLYLFLVLCNNGSLIAQIQNDTTRLTADSIYSIGQVTKTAQFLGGEAELEKYIVQNLIYPRIAFDNEIEGKIIIAFVVNKDGRISDVACLGSKKLGWGCEDAAINLVKHMPKWEPAEIHGQPVASHSKIPIIFTINSDFQVGPLESNKKKK